MEKLELSYTTGGNVKWHSHSGKLFVSLLKKLNIIYHIAKHSILRDQPKRNENICPQKAFSEIVHSSIIHNNTKLETIQISLSWWLDKQNVVYVHNRKPFNNKSNEILRETITWMMLKNIMLSEWN